MGQNESSVLVEQIKYDVIKPVQEFVEVFNITEDDLQKYVNELNMLCQKCMSTDGQQLQFAVKPGSGSDHSILWKVTVRIYCIRYDPTTVKVKSSELIGLSQFVRIFKTIHNELQMSKEADKQTGQQKKSQSVENSLLNRINSVLDDNNEIEECGICFEHKPQNLIILPCTHCYCQPCIDEWHVNNNTCPICREVIEFDDDAWVLCDAPNSAEINEHIAASLLGILE